LTRPRDPIMKSASTSNAQCWPKRGINTINYPGSVPADSRSKEFHVIAHRIDVVHIPIFPYDS